MTGQAGGGAFFITFLICTFFVGLPILLSEYIIGRSTQKDAIRAFKHYSSKKPWHIVGRWGIVGSIILLPVYSVVGGWSIIYLFKTVSRQLGTLSGSQFGRLFESTPANQFLVLAAQL